MATPTRIAFVCLGNICRSPTAKAVMEHLVDDARAGDRIQVDSFGTAGYHVGEPPDARAREEAQRRGITLDHRGQQFAPAEFDRFDLVLAMDRSNAEDLRRIAPDEVALAKIALLREWDPAADGELEVPDPYYGAGDGFARVFDMVERSCRTLLAELTEPGDRC